MPLYRIESGELSRIVSADDWESACIAAVKQENESESLGSLGLLMEVIEVNEPEPSYTSTEHICRKAGLWIENPRRETRVDGT